MTRIRWLSTCRVCGTWFHLVCVWESAGLVSSQGCASLVLIVLFKRGARHIQMWFIPGYLHLDNFRKNSGTVDNLMQENWTNDILTLDNWIRDNLTHDKWTLDNLIKDNLTQDNWTVDSLTQDKWSKQHFSMALCFRLFSLFLLPAYQTP